jgi:hypothetical protein
MSIHRLGTTRMGTDGFEFIGKRRAPTRWRAAICSRTMGLSSMVARHPSHESNACTGRAGVNFHH